MKSRILIIEPSEVITEGLRAALVSEQFKVPEFRYLPDCNIADEVTRMRPDVLIVNPTLIGANRLREFENLIVIALVYQYVPHDSLNAFDAIIDIRDSLNTVVSKVNEALRQGIGENKQKKTSNYELTKREQSVLVLVARGLTNKAIADELNVSIHTVISHRKNIVQKTGIKSVAGLTVYAMVNNLIGD